MSYFTDPNGHPLTWPVIAMVVVFALLQLQKTHVIPWNVPSKFLPPQAYLMTLLASGLPVAIASGDAIKGLLTGLFAGFAPAGVYATLLRPTLATPPASVAPPGAPASLSPSMVELTKALTPPPLPTTPRRQPEEP
jgi:hypothetical protein